MSNGGEEYKSKAFDKVLKNRNIRILQSTSYIVMNQSGFKIVWLEE